MTSCSEFFYISGLLRSDPLDFATFASLLLAVLLCSSLDTLVLLALAPRTALFFFGLFGPVVPPFSIDKPLLACPPEMTGPVVPRSSPGPRARPVPPRDSVPQVGSVLFAGCSFLARSISTSSSSHGISYVFRGFYAITLKHVLLTIDFGIEHYSFSVYNFVRGPART